MSRPGPRCVAAGEHVVLRLNDDTCVIARITPDVCVSAAAAVAAAARVRVSN